MTAEQADKADALYRSRLGSLLAVDDTVAEIIGTLGSLGVLDNTFVAFTSDHGYRFGQFSMPQGKWNAYENDLRIPFFIRGPGIVAGSVFDGLASNVDVMPTLLELAGGAAARPRAWDGRSAAAHLLGRATLGGWRTDLLIEYFSGGEVVRYEHLEDAHNNSFRMLRRLDPTAPVGRANLSFAQFVGQHLMGLLQLVDCNGFAITRIWKAAGAIIYVEPSAFANAFPQPLGPGGVCLRFEHVRMCSMYAHMAGSHIVRQNAHDKLDVCTQRWSEEDVKRERICFII